MKQKLRECRDVEELAKVHNHYTTTLVYQCLLYDKVSPSFIV